MVDTAASIIRKEFLSLTIEDGIEIVRPNKLRVRLYDGSYVDFWWSQELKGRFSFHWERRHIDGTIYRHDNARHIRWRNISTFPGHFHNGAENAVEPSYLPDDPEAGVREFMQFIRQKIET